MCSACIDQSQTHFCAKKDGIVLKTFNRSTKAKCSSNDRASISFCIPHDVVLKAGDINANPRVHITQRPPVEPSDSEDDDLPIASLCRRKKSPDVVDSGCEKNEEDASSDEPPMEEKAEGQEVAYDFGEQHGTYTGAITR
jgi:hypothetical protein